MHYTCQCIYACAAYILSWGMYMQFCCHTGGMTILQGERVMLERRRIDMKQAALADLAGVDQAYISRLERNKIKNVGIDTIDAIANGLGVSIAYLIGLSDSPLGEPSGAVLRELAGEYVTVDVDSEEQRQRVRSLLAEFSTLPAATQGIAIELVRLLRQAVAVEPEPEPVEAMGEDEWNVWIGLLNRFDEPTRRAIERSVGIERDVSRAG